ncbi:hypothetical protein DXG01_008630 [Tephrocybe rancida]|nr:hypothetical protein DXG01_008630 [Tephrocybe rancida]
MYPPAELGSVQTYAPSPTPSPLPYHFPTATHNEACLALNQKGTSYAMMAAMISDPVFTAPAVLGSVRLMLGNKHTIHAAIVSIKGQIITSANATKHFTFLDITKTIWSKSNDITHPSTHPTTSSNVHKDISGKKLTGDHFWPFTIALPKEVLLPSRTKREPELFRLPESFHERHVRASVQYSLHLRLVRGRFRPDNKYSQFP